MLQCKRQGRAFSKMAVACTREMAINHIDQLALEFIDTGIFKNTETFWSGNGQAQLIHKGFLTMKKCFCLSTMELMDIPIRLFLVVRVPNVNDCIRKIGCVTLEPFVSLSGDVGILHAIFSATNVVSY